MTFAYFAFTLAFLYNNQACVLLLDFKNSSDILELVWKKKKSPNGLWNFFSPFKVENILNSRQHKILSACGA